MTELTRNQIYHLILADIAMSMAVQTLKAEPATQAPENGYQPGTIRDGWLERADDKHTRQRVIALANAGLASLSTLDASALLDKAQRFGVPIDTATADEIAQHFVDKRNAVLTYQR
ncbi:MAG TPA: hypothetical protein VM661_03105 [Candidatus Sulfotelmatobacter sp.]|jgi:hypothetical protein|nr:hypothetical protein [Candidatus Sulfotelmatobacter sp.]